MPVFDASTKTKLRVRDPRSDQKLPNPGALSFGSITGSSALSGTTGVDCMKVSGDRWQQMHGKLTEHYSSDKLITVQGKIDEKVTGNYSTTISGGNHSLTLGSGNSSVNIAGQLSEKISSTHSSQVGGSYSLQCQEGQIAGSAMLTLTGGIVKINC